MSVAASAPAQTGNVGGVIIDDRTQQPIEGVQVYVLNQSATADLDGRTIFAVRAEPKRLPNGAIDFGSFDAPWVNVLDGVAKGLEIIVRRGGTGAFSGWAGYALGRLEYRQAITGERFWADADQPHTLTLFGSYRLSSRMNISGRYRYGSNYPLIGYIGEPSRALGVPPTVDRRPLFTASTTSAIHYVCRRIRGSTFAPIGRSTGRSDDCSCSSKSPMSSITRIFATLPIGWIAPAACSKRLSRCCRSSRPAESSSSSDCT